MPTSELGDVSITQNANVNFDLAPADPSQCSVREVTGQLFLFFVYAHCAGLDLLQSAWRFRYFTGWATVLAVKAVICVPLLIQMIMSRRAATGPVTAEPCWHRLCQQGGSTRTSHRSAQAHRALKPFRPPRTAAKMSHVSTKLLGSFVARQSLGCRVARIKTLPSRGICGATIGAWSCCQQSRQGLSWFALTSSIPDSSSKISPAVDCVAQGTRVSLRALKIWTLGLLYFPN
jgi:hypothetical protein